MDCETDLIETVPLGALRISRAAAQVFQEEKVPFSVGYALHPAVTAGGKYVFRVTVLGHVQGRAGGFTAACCSATDKCPYLASNSGVPTVSGVPPTAGAPGATGLG